MTAAGIFRAEEQRLQEERRSTKAISASTTESEKKSGRKGSQQIGSKLSPMCSRLFEKTENPLTHLQKRRKLRPPSTGGSAPSEHASSVDSHDLRSDVDYDASDVDMPDEVEDQTSSANTADLAFVPKLRRCQGIHQVPPLRPRPSRRQPRHRRLPLRSNSEGRIIECSWCCRDTSCTTRTQGCQACSD